MLPAGARVSISAPAPPRLLLSSPDSGSQESRLGEPARHHHRVVGHLESEHAEALASASQHGLLEVGELAAPPGSLGFQLLPFSKQLSLPSLHLRSNAQQLLSKERRLHVELLTKQKKVQQGLTLGADK